METGSGYDSLSAAGFDRIAILNPKGCSQANRSEEFDAVGKRLLYRSSDEHILPDCQIHSHPGGCHTPGATGVFISDMTSKRGGRMSSTARIPRAEITGPYGY